MLEVQNWVANIVTRSTHGRSMFNEVEAARAGRDARCIKPVITDTVNAMYIRRSIIVGVAKD